MKSNKTDQNNSLQTIVFAVLIGLAIFGIIAFLIVSNIRIGQKRGEMELRIDDLQKELQILEEKKEKLEKGIDDTKSESYWEEKVREQGYKKPGEEQVVVLPPETQANIGNEETRNFFQKFLSKIGL